MLRHAPFAATLAGAMLLAAGSPPAARGGAVAPRKGEKVEATNESALVVWDAASKTEHLVRTATFSAGAADFGILVPTPAKPEVAPADPAVFAALSDITRPRTVVETRYQSPEISWRRLLPTGFGAGGGGFANVPPRKMEVEEKPVGDLTAAVIKADDPKAVADWLEKNGYETRPGLADWLKWYADHKWYVTAFKVAAPAEGRSGSSYPTAPAVRLTFTTESPVFPYREPADQKADDGSRLTKVYLLADAKYDAQLPGGGWSGRTAWSNDAPKEGVEKVFADGKLPGGLAAKPWHLTEFEDLSGPKPGAGELSFAPAADRAAVERQPYLVYEYREYPAAWIVFTAIGAVPVLLVIGLFLLRRRSVRRRVAAKAPPAEPEAEDLL